MTRPRQVLIGFDAMEWSLVRRWADEGKLPAMRDLMRRGVRGELATTALCLPDTTWPALCCGVNPGKLGKYFYVQYDGSTGRLRYTSDTDIRAIPFWERLAGAGVRVGLADVPHVPFRGLPGGFRLSNWASHDNMLSPASDPASLLGEVSAKIGKHPVGDCEKFNHDPESQQRLRKAIVEGIAVHGKLFRWLMREREWDVFFAVFPAPHCAGHHFWGQMDAIEEAYRAMDRELSEIVAQAGADARVLAFSGHGMGQIAHASWNLNEILDLLGFGVPGVEGRRAETRKAGVNFWRLLKMKAPAALQYRIKDALPKALQDWLLFLWYAGGRDCSGRRAFSVPNNEAVGAIRVSLRGRDRGGMVEPAEYRAFCEEIAGALGELTDPATGRRVIRKITLTRDEYHGECLDLLPDICVLWDQSFLWSAVRSPRFGTIELTRQDMRTGTHTPHGFLLAAGPGIPAGVEAPGLSTYDIAPTVLEAAGVAIPPELDGSPIRELNPVPAR
jgi:predicted AlkP superfamily phosphohydrolase/phosphomutase